MESPPLNSASDPPDEAGAHCPECDYNLQGTVGSRCPWCGWEIDLSSLGDGSNPHQSVQRYGAAAAAAIAGLGSFAAVAVLGSRGVRLSVFDAFAVLAILLAAGGHLCLAWLAIRTGSHWPMRSVEAARVLTVLALASLAGSVVAAGQALNPSRQWVQGVRVSGVLEFIMRAFFFTIPGWTLLVLRLVSFRRSSPPKERSAITGLESMAPDGPRSPFAIEVIGPFLANQITQSWHDRPRTTNAELEAAIARTWEAETALAAVRHRVLYDAHLPRLVRAGAIDGCLHLELGPTSYREFAGTNLHNPALTETIGPAAFADPLGTSGLVATSDGFLCLGRRGPGVAFHAGYVHTFGGLLESVDQRPDGGFDVFGGILRELHEELGVDPKDISELVLLGMVRDRAIRQPELIFDGTVQLSRENLNARTDRAEFVEEHTAIEFVFDEPEAVAAHLARTDRVTPVAQAALLLHGRLHWGIDWYEQTCFLLFGEIPPVWSQQHSSSPIEVR